MEIQMTMGAVETLNERINILQDELSSLDRQLVNLKGQLGTARAKDAGKKTLKIFFIVVSVLTFFMAFIGLVSGAPAVTILFGVVGFLFVYVINTKLNDITEKDHILYKISELETSISKKQAELEQYRSKKKALILENERKLSDSMDDTVDETFTFESINNTKECPMCAETVKTKAKICRFCGYKFEE